MKNGLDIYRGPNTLFRVVSDFDRIFEQALVNPWNVIGKVQPESREWFEPRVDIQENDENYFLNVDIPGVRKEDLKIDLEGRSLSISGERKGERMQGRFVRSFTLPESADASRIDAKLEHGVLELTIPKAEAAKTRSIEIRG